MPESPTPEQKARAATLEAEASGRHVDPAWAAQGQRLLDRAHNLQNGGRGDLELLSLGMSDLLVSQKKMQDHIFELPKRTEVREMISTGVSMHATTCALARGDGVDSSGLDLKKIGVTAKGRAGLQTLVWVAGAIVIILLVFGERLIQAWERHDAPHSAPANPAQALKKGPNE